MVSYKCQVCIFETIRKSDFNRHQKQKSTKRTKRNKVC